MRQGHDAIAAAPLNQMLELHLQVESKTAFKKLCLDKEFGESITSGTQAVRALQNRLDKWRAALEEISITMPYLKVGPTTQES